MYRFIRYSAPFARSVDSSARFGNLEQELNSWFGSRSNAGTEGYTRSIPVSLDQNQDNLQLTAELPGVQRADVTVEVEDEVLRLRATRKVGSGEQEQTVSYVRDVELPYPVVAEKIVAELKDGLLSLTLPKVEAVKPRKIAVN